MPSSVYLVSSNTTTQAVATVNDVFTLSSDIWGPLGNLTVVSFAPDGDEMDITIANSGVTETLHVPDASDILSLAYTVPEISQADVFKVLSINASTEVITLDGTHGWSGNDQVEFFVGPGGALPTGITADTTYYVASPSGTTLKVSSTSGPGSDFNFSGTTLGGGTAPIYMKFVATRLTAEGFDSVNAATVSSGVSVGYSKTLQDDHAGTSASHVSWDTADLPFYGTITVTPSAGTLSTGPNLNVKFTGRDSTGAAATETLMFSTSEIGAGSPAKTTTKSWSAVTSVSVWSDAASITDWSGTLAFTGKCFPTLNATNGYRYVSKAMAKVNSYAGAGFAATTESSSTGQFEVSKLDALTQTNLPVTFAGTTAAIESVINSQSNLVTVTVSSYEDHGIASDTEYSLGGGTSTAGTADDFKLALAELKAFDIDCVAALTTDATSHRYALAHGVYMQGNGRNDRQVFTGAAAGETYSALRTRLRNLGTGNADILNFFCDEVQIVSFDGTSAWKGPEWAALQAAALSAGNMRVSLTRKRPNVLGHRRNSALLGDDGESDLIRIGITPLTTPPGGVPRYVRWVTAWLEDENDIRTDGAAVRSRMMMYKALRAGLDPLIGELGTSATEGLIEGRVVEVMDQLVRDGTITAWKRETLTVTQEGNTWNVGLEASPATTILFIGIKATFSVPTT